MSVCVRMCAPGCMQALAFVWVHKLRAETRQGAIVPASVFFALHADGDLGGCQCAAVWVPSFPLPLHQPLALSLGGGDCRTWTLPDRAEDPPGTSDLTYSAPLLSSTKVMPTPHIFSVV